MDDRYGSFVWDGEKERANIRKHRVDFKTAARVFQDPKRKIYRHEKQSETEERLFCIGEVMGRVLTVRFTYREGVIRIYGAAYWRKGRRYYEGKNG